jgi:L-alanine-DL-glutamate epimerase-like enolase superfamily enzyme
MALMLDPMGAYRYDDAVRVGWAIEALDFTWYEDPLPTDDVYNYTKLCDQLDIPVLATEMTAGSCFGYTHWVTQRATDMLRGDTGLKAGLTPLLRIAHMAEAFGLQWEVHDAFNAFNNVACLNLAMDIPNCGWIEVLSPSPAGEYSLTTRDYGVENPPAISDGMIAAPQLPGVGVTLDWELLKRDSVVLR